MLGKNTILKAIHNQLFDLVLKSLVWMLGKNTILKAIHNWWGYQLHKCKVWMLGKNTILKAIHNGPAPAVKLLFGVNAG